jgi:hypothetical protein
MGIREMTRTLLRFSPLLLLALLGVASGCKSGSPNRACDLAAPDCSDGFVCLAVDGADATCTEVCDPSVADVCGDGLVCDPVASGEHACFAPVFVDGDVTDASRRKRHRGCARPGRQQRGLGRHARGHHRRGRALSLGGARGARRHGPAGLGHVHAARRGAGLPALPERLPARAAHRRERGGGGDRRGLRGRQRQHRRGAHRRARRAGGPAQRQRRGGRGQPGRHPGGGRVRHRAVPLRLRRTRTART